MLVRQVALVARDLDPVVADLCAVFGLEVGFHDPGVAEFGLRNAVLPVGRRFLEVVSPVRADATAARYLDRNGGDGGYMVLVQTADLAADRRRLAALGVRIVWQVTLDDIAAVHLHPRDVGGAIVSLDQPVPPESWRWGGPHWEAKARTDVVRDLAGVTIEAADPPVLAARWSAVLGTPAPRDDGVLALDGSEIRFVQSTRGDRVGALRLVAADAARAISTARTRGLPTDGRSVRIGGIRFDLA
jgi:glyoxalase-like protein